jgi:hypothetical protein
MPETISAEAFCPPDATEVKHFSLLGHVFFGESAANGPWERWQRRENDSRTPFAVAIGGCIRKLKDLAANWYHK